MTPSTGRPSGVETGLPVPTLADTIAIPGRIDFDCEGHVNAYLELRTDMPYPYFAVASVSLRVTRRSSGGIAAAVHGHISESGAKTKEEAIALIANCARTAAQQAADKVVAEGLMPRGSVIEVQGDRCLIDLGRRHGVEKGDRFAVWRRVPGSGGSSRRTRSCEIRLLSLGEQTAGARVTGGKSVAVGDEVVMISELRNPLTAGVGSFFRKMGLTMTGDRELARIMSDSLRAHEGK